MLTRLIYFAVATTLALASSSKAQNWQLTFDDEFNGDHVDTAKWSYGLPWGNQFNPASDMATYTLDNPGINNPNVYVGGGYLYLVATHTPYPAERGKDHTQYMEPYTSGCLTTTNKFTQTYGKFETRAKLPAGKGLHMGFWLLSAKTHGPQELDVFENIGQKPSEVFMTDHYDPHDMHRIVQGKFDGPDFSADFHVYSLIWAPTTVSWYVDDRLRYSATNAPDKQVSPAVPMEVLLSMQVRGPHSWPGAPDANTIFPAKMTIDYVRVYSMAPATRPSSVPPFPAAPNE